MTRFLLFMAAMVLAFPAYAVDTALPDLTQSTAIDADDLLLGREDADTADNKVPVSQVVSVVWATSDADDVSDSGTTNQFWQVGDGTNSLTAGGGTVNADATYGIAIFGQAYEIGSTAIGFGTVAGTNSGPGSESENATAIGYNCKAYGRHSTCVGTDNTSDAASLNSSMIGDDLALTGAEKAFIAGNDGSSSSDYTINISVLNGNSIGTNSDYSMTFGYNCNVGNNAVGNICFGQHVNMTGSNSVVFADNDLSTSLLNFSKSNVVYFAKDIEISASNKITSYASNSDLTIEPNGTGDLVLDGQNWPQADGTNGQLLQTDGAGQLSWATVGALTDGDKGDITVSSSGASWTIDDDAVDEAMLKAVDTPSDEECLTYEVTTGDFEWQTCGGGSQNLFETIAVSGQSDVVADGTTDTLTLAAGANITLTTNATTDTVTIAASAGASGDSVSIDGVGVTDPDFVSSGDIDFVDTSNTVTANINSSVIDAANMADADHGDFTYASNTATLDTDSVSANELNATGVESELEAVLDLEDMQGAVTDAQLNTTSAIEYVIDGGGSAITTGVKGYLEVPYACTITDATLLADQSGSIVVDVWKDTYANYPPTDADTITASAVPTISASNKSTDGTLTGWTTSITAGDIIGFNVDSASTVTRVTVSLTCTR